MGKGIDFEIGEKREDHEETTQGEGTPELVGASLGPTHPSSLANT